MANITNRNDTCCSNVVYNAGRCIERQMGNGLWEKFEDTKGVIRSRKSKKDRQYNGQIKKDKRTNNDLQWTEH